MRIGFGCHVPFAFAHGGAQIQIEQTKQALTALGMTVEFLRWWDDTQHIDVLHFFGRVPTNLLALAHAKGIKVVQSDLLTAQGSRPVWRHRLHALARATIEGCLPARVGANFNWEVYRRADALVALTPWEAWIMREVFGAPSSRTHVVPNGVESVFLESAPVPRGDWLVCTATITERKRVLELAEAAVVAGTPVWVVGKPYDEHGDYTHRFLQLAAAHPQLVRHEGGIGDRTRLAQIYREARGFVLLSSMESLSLSALEAAACACPLLLSDLPWARSVFNETAVYCPVTQRASVTADWLRRFYDTADRQPPPDRPATWTEVAQQLRKIYESVSQ